MKIKKVLNRPFRNHWDKLFMNLMFTNFWLQDKVTDYFKELDITWNQYQVLKALEYEPDGLSITSIREYQLERNSDISRMINRLTQKKLVEKKSIPTDRRQTKIHLTSHGIQLIQEVEANIVELDRIFYNLSKKEAKSLNKTLDKIRE